MSKRRLLLVLCVFLPSATIGVIGLWHPHHLTAETAQLWQGMHIALIPLFPLIGFAPWLITRRVHRQLGWVAALGGYGFAAYYTALDLLAGVGAGTVQLAGMPEAKGPLYDIARTFGLIGVSALVIACVAAAAAVIVTRRFEAVPGAVLAILGAVLVQPGHIYGGTGTVAMGLLALGFALLALGATRAEQSGGGADSGPAPAMTTPR